MKDEKPKGKVIYITNQNLSNSEICKEIMGMTVKEWAEDIHRNENGKYNHLYKKIIK